MAYTSEELRERMKKVLDIDMFISLQEVTIEQLIDAFEFEIMDKYDFWNEFIEEEYGY